MSALSTIKDLFRGVVEPDFDDEEYGIEDELETEDIAPVEKKREKVSVVRPINARGYEVMVVSPKSFDESLEISKNLIDRRTVVLNLELLDHEQSQRIVDFLAGATYALNGHQQKIGEGVFIFTPNNVNISAEQEKRAAASIADAFWNQVK
ncbi:MAG: cell division protein SepF [bacterium]|nr:cell division protein SepF [bacterium]